MKTSLLCASVRSTRENGLRLGRDFLHPVGDRRGPVNSQGALFLYGTQSALNFRLLRLGQVTSLLDESKPSRRKYLFGGTFFFFFSLCNSRLISFPLLLFLFSYYENTSNAVNENKTTQRIWVQYLERDRSSSTNRG